MKLLLSLKLLLFSTLVTAQTQWYNPLESDVDMVQGRAWGEELMGSYARLPQRVQPEVRERLWQLSRNSAGLAIEFTTNSEAITIKYVVDGAHSMQHMPATGVSGVDLYAEIDGQMRWCRGSWNFNHTDTVTYHFAGIDKRDTEQNYRLYLPLYNSVKSLWIGVQSTSDFEFLESDEQSPIVCYGTSIMQGACASRPGMSWTNIVQRTLDAPLINLGFSGQGWLDGLLFEMLAEIDARIYVIDCMPNMIRNQEKYIYERMIKGVELLREHSSCPILLVEHSGYMNDMVSSEAMRAYEGSNRELRRAYEELRRRGVKGLHYMTIDEIGLTPDSQVDGVHPSDLGMQQYADAYVKKMSKILKLKK